MPRRSVPLALAGIALVVIAARASAQVATPEEIRHADELAACAKLADSERQACEKQVRAKIEAEWSARVEFQLKLHTGH